MKSNGPHLPKILVVYYSHSGNTQEIAFKINEMILRFLCHDGIIPLLDFMFSLQGIIYQSFITYRGKILVENGSTIKSFILSYSIE